MNFNAITLASQLEYVFRNKFKPYLGTHSTLDSKILTNTKQIVHNHIVFEIENKLFWYKLGKFVD